MAPKAYSYLRFSTPEQAQGDSFRRQTALAEAYAAQHGLELDRTLRFADEGVSAFKGRNAATGALRKFLRAVEDGDIEDGSYLLVESLDRISRNAVTDAQGLFLQIIGMGINLVTLGDGKRYSTESVNNNPVDLIMSLLVMIRAHEESATKSRRIKEAWVGRRAKVSDGEILTGQVPAWLKVEDGKIVSIPERAAVVQRIFALTLEGWGRERIARTLNEEGVAPFGRSSYWNYSYINKIQANPAVIGTLTTCTLEHEGDKAYRKEAQAFPAYYPAVVDEETFARVQALRSGAGQPKVKGRAQVKNILAGLAICPSCGSKMVRVSKGKAPKSPYAYLVCMKVRAGAGCQYKAVRIDRIEQIIRDSFPVLQEAVLAHGDGELSNDIEALEANQMGLLDQIEEVVNSITAMGGSSALAKRLRDLEFEHEGLRRLIAEKRSLLQSQAPSSIRARLKELNAALGADNTGAINLSLRELFKSVIVNYQSGYLTFNSHNGAVAEAMYKWE